MPLHHSVFKVKMDDIPPPPYSVRDPHSPNTASRSVVQEDIQSFNVAIPPINTTSGFALHHGISAGTFSAGSSSVHPPDVGTPRTSVAPMLTPTPSFRGSQRTTNDELSKSGFVSALPYFELRSPSQPKPSDTIFHHMIITVDAGPHSLLFPQPLDKWTRRELDSHDWMTFLNHLFPFHGVRDSESQELGVYIDLSLGGLGLVDQQSQREQSIPLLGNSPTDIQNYGPGERLMRMRIEAVIDQWNEGFFRPRGLRLTADISQISSPERPEAIPRRSSGNVLQKRPPPGATETLLHQAVTRGKKSGVALLLQNGGEDLEALNKKGETPLFSAVSRSEKAIVQLLLENGANPDIRGGSENNTALSAAVYHDNKSILKFLLEKSTSGIEERSFTGETPLYLAVKKQRRSCMEVLLDYGANPNSRPTGQESMLNLAVKADQKSLAKPLLQKGVNTEERNKDGDTPLCRAVSRGSTSMVKLLLEHGASASARSSKGEAPLSIAVSRGDSSICSLLLSQKDIDFESENAKGETPLYTAITRGDTSIAESLLRKGANSSHIPPDQESMLNKAASRGSSSLTHLLLEQGANVEDQNRSRETPLFQAVARGDASIVSILLAKGADANTRNLSGEPALYRAAYRGDTSIVSLLLAAGANAETIAPGAGTPLYRAVLRGDTSNVSLLLSHGARTDTRCLGGESPLYRAVYRSDTSIVSLLLGSGADPETTCVGEFGDTVLGYAEKKWNKSKGSTILHLLLANKRPKVPVKN
jgi:ankyrin repeat protein